MIETSDIQPGAQLIPDFEGQNARRRPTLPQGVDRLFAFRTRLLGGRKLNRQLQVVAVVFRQVSPNTYLPSSERVLQLQVEFGLITACA